MRTLNLGILAHVDAGKTSLTERLLYAAGVIDEVGRVDDGSTQTDTLALERQRGITIKSAVVSFTLGDLAVNLIDTPGHPDFIAEVERVLGVLDGAVLVVSAVEGVQAQTRILWRALRRLRVPTIIFVNKIDRTGADTERVLRAISLRLTPAVVGMVSTAALGTRRANVTPLGAGDVAFTARLAELVAEHDDALLAEYVDGKAAIGFDRLRAALAAQSRSGLVHPVFAGSAITGAGIDALIAGLGELLPAAGSGDGPLSATVFKIERGPAREKIAYVRVFTGTVRTRDRLDLGGGRSERVTAISVFDGGKAARRPGLAAGQIGKLWGLAGVRVGDSLRATMSADLGGAGVTDRTVPRHFAPPTLQTVVTPKHPNAGPALYVALTELAEADPLIDMRADGPGGDVLLSLYGEVQKEVIGATLADDFGIEVEFSETTTICIERPVGSGSAAEFMGAGTHPFRATLGLRIDPGDVGSGVVFRLEIEAGALTASFIKAIEQTVSKTLGQGLHGWPVTDCRVTVTHSGYVPPPPYGWSKYSSSASDFRHLTPLVLMEALGRAGTGVYEPMDRFQLEIPAGSLGAVLPVLARMRAVPRVPVTRGPLCLLDGDIPAAEVAGLRRQLAALTSGEGVVECVFHHYEPVSGEIPVRKRTDHNPLSRKEYLLHVAGTMT